MTTIQKMFDGDFECHICMSTYDNVKKIPHKICTNEHLCCEDCLWQMYIELEVEFRCPLCKVEIDKTVKVELPKLPSQAKPESTVKEAREMREIEEKFEKEVIVGCDGMPEKQEAFKTEKKEATRFVKWEVTAIKFQGLGFEKRSVNARPASNAAAKGRNVSFSYNGKKN